ncbi:MAG: bifunctional phosphoglucose/phosphomannose isomerase [Methanomassiliicoccales archaeon]|jgi:glucose/mannose-6-phosphate isomerase
MLELLGDLERISRIDKSDMLGIISGFTDQLRTSLSIALSLRFEGSKVCICGMGGSAIGGDILSEYLCERSEVLLSVVRGGRLPSWVDEDTLTIIMSYSGNTREALALFDNAIDRGSPLVAITSGGELLKRCKEGKFKIVLVPFGIQPRAALGHLLGSIASLLESAGVSTPRSDLKSMLHDLESFKNTLVPGVPAGRNAAKRIAKRLLSRMPIIYAPKPLRPAATRWQTQINENAKMMAASGEIPEMDHNQIVGWIEDGRTTKCIPVILNNESCGEIIGRILDETVKMLRDSGLEPEAVGLPGNDNLGAMVHGVILGDFVSFYLAMLKGVDPTPVASIQELKRRIG